MQIFVDWCRLEMRLFIEMQKYKVRICAFRQNLTKQRYLLGSLAIYIMKIIKNGDGSNGRNSVCQKHNRFFQ